MKDAPIILIEAVEKKIEDKPSLPREEVDKETKPICIPPLSPKRSEIEEGELTMNIDEKQE